MRLLVRMIPLVNRKIGGSGKAFLAESALVRFNAHVSSHVNNQIIVSDEPQAAF